MKSRCLTALAVVLLIAGCGQSSRSTVVPTPQVTPGLPPETARVPDGAQPAAPPVGLAPLTTSVMHVDATGLHLIEGFEGWSSCPYWDPYGRVWTRGYGETEGISSGSACISRAQGESKLRLLVETRYEWSLRSLGVQLNQHQWDALCSFVWNLGAGIFQGTTVGADLRARAFYAASRVMLQYDHAGGIVLAGLRARREAEVRLFLTPVKVAPKRNRAAEHAHLKALDKERAKIRRHLLNAGCRVKHPRAACTPLRERGAAVNREIRVLKARGVK